MKQKINRLLATSPKYLPLFCLIVIFAILHLPGITNPPLDEHNWRQTDTAAVARNFQTESANILYPRVDGRQEYTGITGMEFPIYNYSIYSLNMLFGFEHWHGRVISLLASTAGLVFFYLLVENRYKSRRLALLSTLILGSSPLWFYFSRNIQPDITMVSLGIGSVFFAQKYFDTKKIRYFYLGLMSLTLACLIKIPAIFIVLPIIYILGKSGLKSLLFNWRHMITIIIAGLVIALWYWHSGVLSRTYGLGQYYYGDLSLGQSWALITTVGFWKIMSQYVLPVKISTLFLVMGLMFGTIHTYLKRDYLAIVWLIAAGAFLVIFANKSFYHNYYSLLIIPPLALLIGHGVRWFWLIIKPQSALLAKLFVGLVVFSCFWFGYHGSKPLYTFNNPALRSLESVTAQFVPSNQRIVVNYGSSPAMLYFANRKGWSYSDDQINTESLLSLQRLHGVNYYIRYHNGDNSLVINNTDIVYNDTAFTVYRIAPKD